MPIGWQIKSGRRIYFFAHKPIIEPIYETSGIKMGAIIFDDLPGASVESTPGEKLSTDCICIIQTALDKEQTRIGVGRKNQVTEALAELLVEVAFTQAKENTKEARRNLADAENIPSGLMEMRLDDTGAKDKHNCPTCASPKPELHPSMQPDGGEVQICRNPWHSSPVPLAERPQKEEPSDISICPRCMGTGVYNMRQDSLCNGTGRLGPDGLAFAPAGRTEEGTQ